MKKIEAIIRPEKLDDVKHALAEKGYIGLNIVGVTGRGVQKGIVHTGRSGQAYSVDMLPKVKLETVVTDKNVDEVVETILNAARTGNIGDGKIFVMPVDQAIRVRTGERGDVAV
ncbi:MAG TPA: P-II family nitrogen regulator [Dehalococcoidia bacterium]|nr:P-II family nitrogen regulator [Dehalococcoidia bacterium]